MDELAQAGEHGPIGRGGSGERGVPGERRMADSGAFPIVRGEDSLGELASRALRRLGGRGDGEQ